MSIEIDSLRKNFGSVCALDNITLHVKSGSLIGLIGADGAGKTTLLRVIAGLLKADSGSVLTCREKLGYMPQKFGLYEDLSVYENLRLYADLKGVKREFGELLKFAGLEKFQDRLAGQLSGGMKQKLGLICAFLGEPEVLLLDEPSVGVDPISRRELMKMVKQNATNKSSVIWATSYMDEAHGFEKVVVMHLGKIVYEGDPHLLGETTAQFENAVIELMGGYKQSESLVAKNYKPSQNSYAFGVEALSLEKRYGEFYAVKNNTFEIKRGEIFGLLGPNGAGKSTSFKMMCGLIAPSSGTAKIMGVDIVQNPSLARSNLGYMAQKFSLYENLSVKQNLEFFAGAYGLSGGAKKRAVYDMLEFFALEKYKDENSGAIPLGFKQRLSLACCLMHHPAVLFLDEPTSGVDIVARREFWNHILSLAKKGITVLVTTHFMDEAEYCDRITLFYKGESIATGTPIELKQSVNAPDMQSAFIELILKSDNV